MTLIAAYLLVALSSGQLSEPQAAQPPERDHAQMDRLVQQACDREVVLLGEDNGHGSGRAFEAKAILVERLVRECGFSAVMFESQAYDFLALDEALAAGTVTPQDVADAIGGLWSGARELDALIPFLHRSAGDGTVRLYGLDPRTGGATQRYTQERLPARLAQWLETPLREECTTEIGRLTRWTYTTDAPWGEEARLRLRACSDAIEGAVDGSGVAADAADAVMVRNFAQAVRILEAAGENPQAASRIRSEAMFENFRRHRLALPGQAKAIVWTATVHAARRLSDDSSDLDRFGARVDALLGRRAMVVGFSAVSGSHGRRSTAPAELPPASEDSLERRVLGDMNHRLMFADREELLAIGEAPGRAVSYGRTETRRWADAMDGLVVFGEDRPPDFARPSR